MNKFDTKILPCDEEGLREAADVIKSGGIVAMPTETVYGLAANALDPRAVESVFKAKGRPADNPLIVHLSSCKDIELYTENVPDLAYKLFERFAPGPLTIVLPKKAIIPDITSGGLKTVGIRIPANDSCRRLIELAGVPIAAPSANISGKPSPTKAEHVFDDIGGKIPLILDGGRCTVGIESTVISLLNDKIRILRPGFVTAEDLSNFGEVIIDSGINGEIPDDKTAESPGMKYKHYAPDCEVFLVNGTISQFAEYFTRNANNAVAIIMNSQMLPFVMAAGRLHLPNNPTNKLFTSGEDETEFARSLFGNLRDADKYGFKYAYILSPEKNGVGLAVYNRLIRAAGFKIIDL
jgi:L-threonylcarbamoyladenylate synthase